MKIHRKRSIETEAFYVMLAVREDKRREVLGIFNKPTERALGWGEMLAELHERGVRKIGLVCADGLKGLEDVISTIFPGAPLQRCTTHLKRNLLSCVRNGDKGELAEDLRQVSVRGIAAIRWREPGNNGRHSVRNGVRIIAVFDDGRKIRLTRPTSPI